MARPKNEQPTPAELEVLQILWDSGPLTVRQVMHELNPQRPRAYTSVMSLLTVMTEKGLVERSPQGRAFLYAAADSRSDTLGSMVTEFVKRAFGGSSSALVAQLLDESNPTAEELEQIRNLIEQHTTEDRTDDR